MKMVYENYKIQLIDVFIIPAVNGKKGHSFILEVTQARDKILSTVPVEFSVLKELNDALVELNPSYEQYAKFPAINAGGFSGLTKITQAQIDERATQLCQWIAGVMTSVAPASLIMNPTPPPYVISNPRVDNAAAYPLMPGDIKLDLAELLQIPVSVLDPITVQLPQSKSKNDLGLLHIKTALDALAVTDPAQVDIQVKQNHDAKDDLPKVSVAVSRVEKSDKIAMNKKVFYQTEFLIGNHIYLFVKEFSAYRKLYEDLRMRGIGYNVLQDAAVDEIPPSAPLEPIESSVDSSDSDSDDSGFEGSNKKRNRKPKVKEMFSNLLTSKPTRHGSFSEIELDIQLSVPFPRKFHTKLTSKDLAERCTALDSWMRSLMMNYHKLSLETKDIVNNFLGFFDNLEADQLMNLINVIDRITHAGAVSENSHLAPVALIGDSSHSDMTSLTAGTREGGGSILKTAAAAIGGLVRPSQPTRETFQEKSDGSSSGGDDSSSVPAQPLVEALAQETDNSQTSSTTNTLVHEKSAIIPATQPANVPVAVSTLQVDANPAVIAPLNENGAGKSSGNAVVVNSAVNLETKMNPQVDKKGTENAPNKANVVVVDQEDNEVAPLPNPKGCCIIS